MYGTPPAEVEGIQNPDTWLRCEPGAAQRGQACVAAWCGVRVSPDVSSPFFGRGLFRFGFFWFVRAHCAEPSNRFLSIFHTKNSYFFNKAPRRVALAEVCVDTARGRIGPAELEAAWWQFHDMAACMAKNYLKISTFGGKLLCRMPKIHASVLSLLKT